MSFDDYANHIYQKHRLATALAVIKIKPKNITTEDFLEQLKSKISKMDDDDDITVCSDDFLMDDDEGNDSETIFKDFDEEIISHQIVLDDRVEPTHTTENNSQITFYEPSQYTTESTPIANANTVKTAEVYHNIHKNLVVHSLNGAKDLDKDLNTNFDLNAEMQLGEKHKNDINIPKEANVNTDVTFYDSQQTQLYSVPSYSQNYTHYSQSQNNISIPKQYLYKNRSKTNISDPNTVLGQENLETVKENDRIYENNYEISDDVNTVIEGTVTNTVKNNNIKENNNSNALITQESNDIYIVNDNNKDFETNNGIPDDKVQYSQNIDKYFSEMQYLNGNNITGIINMDVDYENNPKETIPSDILINTENFSEKNVIDYVDVSSFKDNTTKNTTVSVFSENTEKNNEKTELNDANLHQFRNLTESLSKNTYADVISEKNNKINDNFRQNNTPVLQNSSFTEKNPKNTLENGILEKNNENFGQNNSTFLQSKDLAEQNSDFTEVIPKNTHVKEVLEKNNENVAQNNAILLQSKDLAEEYKITEDYDSDEIISYKVLEEFNKVKIFVRRPKRRISSDSYSSDSGYKSDSQRSNRSALQLSGSWLNQSGSCLFHYLLQCPLVAATRDITNEIAQVLSELIDKLHEEEKYPSFLEELLETIEVSLRHVFEGVNSEDNEFLKKDERIQRILLLNKSIHIQKHTIEKITTILEEFHTNITQIDSTYELQNIDEIENISYIFHILEISLKKYLKNKLNESQISSQNSQDEKMFKKSSITDIWRKKWNPSQKKTEGSREKKCVLKLCSDVLNRIVVDCLSSYSLVAYSALKCFNTMQN